MACTFLQSKPNSQSVHMEYLIVKNDQHFFDNVIYVNNIITPVYVLWCGAHSIINQHLIS